MNMKIVKNNSNIAQDMKLNLVKNASSTNPMIKIAENLSKAATNYEQLHESQTAEIITKILETINV